MSDWELVVWRRRALGAQSGKPFWMHERSTLIERIPMPPPADLLERLGAHRAQCEPGWERIAYHLRRARDRDTVIASGQQLTDHATGALQQAIPLLHPINWVKPTGISAHKLLARDLPSLRDLGFGLSANSDQGPLGWRFVASGPSIMVTSASGMYLRGQRFYIAVWPGPGDGQAAYVGLCLIKRYASGGRDGFLARLYYGPDLRKAVRACNESLRAWQGSEHYRRHVQPAEVVAFDASKLMIALAGEPNALTGDWQELDALARRAITDPNLVWPSANTPVTLEYVD